MLRLRSIIAFMAVLVLYSSGAAAGESATDKYFAILQSLDTSSLDSIAEATKAYQTLFADKRDVAAQDEAFDLWEKFTADPLDEELDRVMQSDLGRDIRNNSDDTLDLKATKGMQPETKQYLADLRKRGLAVQIAEGSPGIEIAFSYVRNTFFPYLSEAKQRFLTLVNEYQEDNYKYGSDKIPPEILRSRIIDWEALVTKYPSGPDAKHAAYLLREKVQMYVLAGMEDGVLTPNEKKSFRKFLMENKDSRFYPLMKEYCQYLETHQFKPDLEMARKLLDKYNQ